MSNLWSLFSELIPRPDLELGTVATVHSDGTTTLTLFAGGTVRVQGAGHSVGDDVFFRAGATGEAAPTMPLYEVTV